MLRSPISKFVQSSHLFPKCFLLRAQSFSPVLSNLKFPANFSTKKPNSPPIEPITIKPTTNEVPPLPSEDLVQKGKEKLVGTWLLLTAGSVLVMILLGGYTRLSKSGLSMTKWKPIAYKYPSNPEEWDREFENYKKFPEYQLSNKGMSVEEFKNIFLIEYVHRYLGQSIGFIYAVPFMTFLGLGYLKPKLTKRCLGLLALGGTQGLIGWWMVKSGLKEKPDYQSRPRVSTYRLFVHLNTAVVIYSVLYWNAMNLLRQAQEKVVTAANYPHLLKIKRGALLMILFLSFNIMSGALVAGIDAGKVFNTWPLMNDDFIPRKYWDEKFPTAYANIIENKANVQCNHRMFAYLTYFSALALWFSCRKLPVPKPCKRALNLLFALVNMQVLDGIITLLYMVPVWFGVVHQAGALTVLTSGLHLVHTARNPSKGFLNKIKKVKV